ncbi:hypothetical protein I4U23_019630 [Adineta vaga]|nr:hypothetical protein I4U23_019630 [Adineta vaga]
MLNTTLNSIMFYHQWSTDKFLRIFILSSILCLTLFGNIYILFELLYHRHRTRLHLFIFNLAIGDLTICCCTMTSELFLILYDQEWILGNIACKLTLYIQIVTIASTTFINVAMTYDRYEAVCCPLRIVISFGRIYRIIILCWLCSFIVAIPQVFIFEQSLFPGNSTKHRCASTGYTAEWQRRAYFTIFVTYILIIPVICMTFWYIQIISAISISSKVWTQHMRGETIANISVNLTSPTKVKTVKLALTIIIVFVICWTPYMVLTLIEIYSNGRFRIPSWGDAILKAMCFIQSSLNPFIYLRFNQRKKYSPILILAAASTLSNTNHRKNRRKQRERGGSISLNSFAEVSFRKNTFTSIEERPES